MRFNESRSRAFGAVTLAVAFAALAAPSAAQDWQLVPKPRTLSVTGEGIVRVAPERARVSVGVTTEAPTARQAARDNADRMVRVVEALRSSGVPTERIQTVQLTIEPVYDYNQPGGRPVLRAFQARNVVEAVTEDLEGLGDLVDAVIGVGGNTVQGITFELRDPGAAEARALETAVADARRKAEVLARASGVEIGDVQEINATYGAPPIPFMRAQMATMEARADASTPVAPGELAVSSNVQVTYRLEGEG